MASRRVRAYLENVKEPIVLGGFSQGAMTSAEIAFHSDQELAGLILLSGTTVDEEGWAEHLPAGGTCLYSSHTAAAIRCCRSSGWSDFKPG